MTNWHVIRDADQVVVQLADGREAHPRFVGADPETELALLSVDLPDLPAIRLGRSDTLNIGDVVLAIGNAYGLSQSVTSGIVSATGRGIGLTIFENFIQTDAAINIGNSGGALVNTRGELIGINTARFATLNRSPPEGIGFAIPVNLVRGVMDELIEHGRVIRGWLGVDAWDLPSMNAAALGISGPAVELAEVGGPAAAAGLIAGDIITHINDERMLSRDQAMNRVAGLRPGDTIHIRGHRPGAGAFETLCGAGGAGGGGAVGRFASGVRRGGSRSSARRGGACAARTVVVYPPDPGARSGYQQIRRGQPSVPTSASNS